MLYLSLLIVVYIAGEMNASLPTHLPNKISCHGRAIQITAKSNQESPPFVAQVVLNLPALLKYTFLIHCCCGAKCIVEVLFSF